MAVSLPGYKSFADIPQSARVLKSISGLSSGDSFPSDDPSVENRGVRYVA